MTKEELLRITTWDEIDIGTCSLYTNLFARELAFQFFQDHQPKPTITDKMTECVNDVLALDPSELDTVKEILWEVHLFSFHVVDFGFEPEGNETDFEAFCREFGASNKEEVYLKSSIQKIEINQENDALEGRYAQIVVGCPSDQLIHLVVKNGKLIDFDDDGCTMNTFEQDEQQARKQRAALMK